MYQLTEPALNWTDQFGHIDASPDHVWCGPTGRLNNLRIGSDLDQAPIVGQHSLVLLRLNASGATLPGLKASFRVIYRFDRAFGVPGAPVTSDMCQFLYSPSSTPFSVLATAESVGALSTGSAQSRAHPRGWTNSPFYPNPYPSNSTCLYLFLPNQTGPRRERIRLSFGTFETQSGRHSSTDLTGQLMPFSLCDQNIPIVFVLTRLRRCDQRLCVEAKGLRVVAKALRVLAKGMQVKAKGLRVLAKA
ncbi:unnamed protein product [Echinostoma caproni]|uniref:CUB domain-containing protein n=1 Tax=Echinostoma caproni TaxID=27848 RepID=A0A3P8FP49_9TREM|nr:unnamed protein product [Echinostoma caproni]